ncbi:MAG: type II CAAX endopeptidase family protein [Candidatus Anstonellaceae archaeon]
MHRVFALILAFAFFLIYPPWAPSSLSVYLSLLLLFVGLFLSNRNLKKAAKDFGMLPPFDFAKVLMLGAAASIFCFTSAFAISTIFSFLGILDSGKVIQKIEQLPASVLVFSFTIAPIAEEVFFRGFLLHKLSLLLKGKFSFVSASLLSSMIFSVVHLSYGSVAQFAVAFLVGLILCATVRISGTLLPAILAHAIFNFSSVALFVLCKAGYCQF